MSTEGLHNSAQIRADCIHKRQYQKIKPKTNILLPADYCAVPKNIYDFAGEKWPHSARVNSFWRFFCDWFYYDWMGTFVATWVKNVKIVPTARNGLKICSMFKNWTSDTSESWVMLPLFGTSMSTSHTWYTYIKNNVWNIFNTTSGPEKVPTLRMTNCHDFKIWSILLVLFAYAVSILNVYVCGISVV